MRVLLVSNGYPPSGQWGTEFYTHQLASGLRARGHTVAVFCPDRESPGPRYSVARSVRDGVHLFQVANPPDRRKRFADSYRSPGVERAFGALLRELRPDVVHATHLLWGLSVRLPRLAREAGARVVVTLTDYGLLCHRGQLLTTELEPCAGPEAARCARCIRSVGPFEAGPLTRSAKAGLAHGLAHLGGLGLVVTPADLEQRRAAVAEALADVHHVLAPTEVLARRFRPLLPAHVACTTLCYGLDERPFRTAPERAPDGRLRFGYLGQFQPHKGLDVLLAAAGRLRRTAPGSRSDWELVLHGNAVGGRHRHFLGRSWDPALADRVRFAGPFAPLDAPRAMARLDALVVPSVWSENAPLTVLQARAMGLRLVASDVPGVREVAPADARLVTPGDPAALARALSQVLLEGPVRRRPASLPVAYDAHLAGVERLYLGGAGPAPPNGAARVRGKDAPAPPSRSAALRPTPVGLVSLHPAPRPAGG